MAPKITARICLRGLSAVALASALLLAGCGKAPEATELAKPAAKKASTPAPEPAAAASTNRPAQYVSVFSTKEPRDPFNPRVKPKTAATAAQAAVEKQSETAAIVSALQAGYNGIIGTAERRELVVFGNFLQEGREVTLSVPVNGAVRRVKVKPIKISRASAEVQVEGVAQPVTLSKSIR